MENNFNNKHTLYNDPNVKKSFTPIIAHIRTLISLKSRYYPNKSFFRLIPNYIINININRDYYNVINLLINLVSRENIIDFKGMSKYIELKLTYSQTNNFAEFEENLASKIIVATDISQVFRGYFLLNMLDINGELDNTFLSNLVSTISRLEENVKFIFIVNNNKIEQQLKENFNIHNLSTNRFTVVDYFNYSLDMIREHNIDITNDAAEELLSLIESLSDKELFKELVTIKKISRDLIYLTSSSQNNRVLNRNLLSLYISDSLDKSSYCSKQAQIGFGGLQ